jgi:hypothetical protein
VPGLSDLPESRAASDAVLTMDEPLVVAMLLTGASSPQPLVTAV